MNQSQLQISLLQFKQPESESESVTNSLLQFKQPESESESVTRGKWNDCDDSEHKDHGVTERKGQQQRDQ